MGPFQHEVAMAPICARWVPAHTGGTSGANTLVGWCAASAGLARTKKDVDVRQVRKCVPSLQPTEGVQRHRPHLPQIYEQSKRCWVQGSPRSNLAAPLQSQVSAQRVGVAGSVAILAQVCTIPGSCPDAGTPGDPRELVG